MLCSSVLYNATTIFVICYDFSFMPELNKKYTKIKSRVLFVKRLNRNNSAKLEKNESVDF